jgi:hypothetical protein
MDLSENFMLAGSAVEVYLVASKEDGMQEIEHISQSQVLTDLHVQK